MSNLTKQEIELLKSSASNVENLDKETKQQVLTLLSNSQNASQIIQNLSEDELYNLVGRRNYALLDCLQTWPIQSKIQLVNKTVKVFYNLPYTFEDSILRDQDLLKACLKAMNAQFPSASEKYTKYKLYFDGMNLRNIMFNQENFETLLRSLPGQSPFIFQEAPFSAIRNWRQLIKTNPNLALENRMLEAMENVDFFSKTSLLQFKEQNDDLLRNKVFYNNFIQKASWAINDKISSARSSAESEIDDAEFHKDYAAMYDAEDGLSSMVSRFEASLKFIESNFGMYKDIIMQQEMARKLAAKNGTAQ